MSLKPDRALHTLRTLALTDVLRAALLVLAMALVGLCLFVLAVLGVLGLGDKTLDPATLEPGLGLSNQALTIAFALAGALASTIVAYAALRAQTSANEAQIRGAAAAEKARVYAALRRDLLRHAAVIGAFHTVFSRAHEITEDLLRSLTDQMAQTTNVVDQPLARHDLPSRDADHKAAILSAHHSFWQAIAEAQKTERPDLALDQLWLARQAGGKDPSHLINLGRAFGFFGLKGTATADPLPPGTLAARGTPMTLAVAQDILRLARHGVSRLTLDALSDSFVQTANEIAGPNGFTTRIDTELDAIFDAAEELTEQALHLTAQSEDIRDTCAEIRGQVDHLADDGPERPAPEYLTEAYDDAYRKLITLADNAESLMADLANIKDTTSLGSKVQEDIKAQKDLTKASLDGLLTKLQNITQMVATQSHAGLLLARHGAGPSGDAVAALSAFVAGAIVLPDGALLCAGQPHRFVAAEWKANLGLALFEDLSRLYLHRSGDADGTIDLARLIPDDSTLGSGMFDTLYGQDRATQIGALPAAFDALWLMLRKDPETLALLTLQEAALFQDGSFNFAGALQATEGTVAKAISLLEGRDTLDLVLILDPGLNQAPTQPSAQPASTETPKTDIPDDEIPS